MHTRPVYVLAAQEIGYRPDTYRIIVAQHWTGFPGGRDAFAISVNDQVTGKRLGTPDIVAREYAAAAALLSHHRVTEDHARDLLERQQRPRERHCEQCRTRLPLGGLYCTRCGLPGGRRAATPFRPAHEPVAG